MSLSTYAELWRGLRIKKGRNVKKKRCMLTDSLRTRFNQDLYDAGEQVLDHDERYGYVVKDLLVYLINSADSEDTTLGRGQQRLRAHCCCCGCCHCCAGASSSSSEELLT